MAERSGEGEEVAAVPQAPEMSVTGWIIRWVLWMSLGFVITSPMYVLVMDLRIGRKLNARAVCAAHLHRIGKSVALYASENDDSFPHDFYALVQSGQPADLFQCPSTGTPEPETDERADFEAHCDYVYVAGLKSATPGSVIMAFELPVNHSHEYVNLLRADFSTYGMGPPGFVTLIQKSNDYLSERRRGLR